MKIQLLSDLHLEANPGFVPTPLQALHSSAFEIPRRSSLHLSARAFFITN